MKLLSFLILGFLYFAQDIGLSWWFQRKFARDDNSIGKNAPDDLQKYFGRVVYFTLVYYFLILIYLITDFDFWGLISNVSILNKAFFEITGFILGLVFLMLMALVRLNLGSSWRKGLDYNTTNNLVTGGLYRFVRNPYFTSSLVFQFSLILLIPNAIMICSFVQSLVLLGLQVRQEESFLQEKYGEQYTTYKETTGRFLPKIS